MANPTLARDVAERLARVRGCTDKVMILGLRSPSSKYGEYDDTLALLTPQLYIEWKGNTLPSKWEKGIACLQPGDYKWCKGLHGIHHFEDIEKIFGKPMRDRVEVFLDANLAAGRDYPGTLKDHEGNVVIVPYPAFRQAGPMIILRDGETQAHPDGWPGDPSWIDGHHGGWNGTSSAACQTWHPEHWLEARAKGYSAMDQYGQLEITYGLHQL